ncbi:unnamed protein product [Rotaria socialis]|uniref:EF-hand domain-containing protein n=2 Tax=Rotaria socialis TaxID=392032 RepID=A0A821ILT6_9BILA|nr:unnamed protein product [Rotaria socialis]CAF3333816.1 unnamed protein product [Rotaria socialis]CAF3612081.1 unnamed protein product [Rotaria socialis]CAF3704499.1 unnamed protein product [Rotaria socialis]CAF4223008.1 unnamed protein product [Rotaria socialis]
MATHDAYELKLLFSLFDTNHDGRITQDEIKQLVETVSGQILTEEQLAAFMKIMDTDTNGDITVDEFTVMMNEYLPTSTLGLRDLFNTFDLSADGVVDKQEFDQVMKDKGKDLNQDQINIFSNKFQQDENCKVTYEEFIDGAMEVYKNIKFN